MAESSTSAHVVDNKDENMDEEMHGITMLDVLKEEQELEDDVKAVLGASDDQNCTYSRGYVKRQALYACMTCIPLDNKDLKPAGICLACSYHCHEGHELVELYTKRNFKCDCGNSRFPNNKCNLESNKSEVNEQNKYNQNFRGEYCTCKRPYPDPEDSIDDEMIQCIICEDWYHGRHLGNSIPPQHDYGEMICSDCIANHPFLSNYKGYATSVVTREENVGSNGDVKVETNIVQTEGSSNATDTKVESSPVAGSNHTSGCVIQNTKPVDEDISTVYFQEGWRKHLCTCNLCQALYAAEGVSFLADEQDTVRAYEEKGKASINSGRFESQYERGMRALSSMDRVQQVEAIEEYNNMKSQLKDYLQKFVENKKVVREEDIREFFSGMEARKRQRVDVQPPHYCH